MDTFVGVLGVDWVVATVGVLGVHWGVFAVEVGFVFQFCLGNGFM